MPSLLAKINQLLPTRVADATNTDVRVGSYGDAISARSVSAADQLGVEGNYFAAMRDPLAGGDGLAMSITTNFNSGLNARPFQFVNRDGVRVAIIKYLRMRCTAAVSTTTSSEIAFEIAKLRRGSLTAAPAGNLTIYNLSPTQTGVQSTAEIAVGLNALLGNEPTASAFGKVIGHQIIRKATAPSWVVNDTLTFTFGNTNISVPQNVGIAADTTAMMCVYQFGPAIVPPGYMFMPYVCNVANATTAPSFEFEVGWIER